MHYNRCPRVSSNFQTNTNIEPEIKHLLSPKVGPCVGIEKHTFINKCWYAISTNKASRGNHLTIVLYTAHTLGMELENGMCKTKFGMPLVS